MEIVMDINEIIKKRSILFSTRMQFSPKTQPIRESAIDKIIEQNLLILDNDKGLTLHEIEESGAFCYPDQSLAISRVDIEKSLDRLIDSGRMLFEIKEYKKFYKLAEETKIELNETLVQAEKRLNLCQKRYLLLCR